jgi:hypothetical protein
MATLFFSYSHRDELLRNELEIHLSALKRQGIIDTWHDRRIPAGSEVDTKISGYLEKADIILLMVSPYFIASDYCYDVEMKRAMERHERGEATVIPVILHPCDWHRTPFGKLMAVPTDGKPISKFPNQHDAFLEITEAIRNVCESMGGRNQEEISKQTAPRPDAASTGTGSVIRSSNLRVKKKFTEREQDQFMTEAFEYIANFFEGSLSELKARNPEIDTDYRRIDANRFTAAVYVGGSVASRCKIWLVSENRFTPGINYSTDVSGDGYNERLTVENDGYTLFLKPSMGMFRYGGRPDEQMTLEGGAEYLWGSFIERLQQ